jgi:uncharacterized membrane protein YjjB (DUF3815 family)
MLIVAMPLAVGAIGIGCVLWQYSRKEKVITRLLIGSVAAIVVLVFSYFAYAAINFAVS